MSSAKAAKGTCLKIGDGGGTEAFTTIAEITDYSGPGRAVGTIDVTNFDSTAKEFISDALVDNGEITFGCNFIGSNTQHKQLVTDMEAGTKRNFKLLLNDSVSDKTEFSFAALVTKFDGPSAGGVAEVYKVSCTLKISGAITADYTTG